MHVKSNTAQFPDMSSILEALISFYRALVKESPTLILQSHLAIFETFNLSQSKALRSERIRAGDEDGMPWNFGFHTLKLMRDGTG